ncbi:hypothetical protein KA344_07760 [bacterium]|nr:hypothetical protein [bacterium]
MTGIAPYCAAQSIEKAECSAFPLHKQVIPQALSVVIYSHKLAEKNGSPAWSFVTEGLATTGQPEMIMTIIQDNNEEIAGYPRAPEEFFKTIFALAKEGRIVHQGDYTRFGDGGHEFIAPQFHGAIYLPAQSFPGVKVAQGTLAVIPLTTDELDAYEVGGPSRITGRLAHQSSYYPFPTWCDRTRASVFSAADVQAMKAEPVSHAPSESLYEAGVIEQGTRLSLSVPPKAQKRFADLVKSLPDETAVMLMLGVDPRANAFLVWGPGDAKAVSPPGSDGSILSGAFVELLPGVSKNEFRRFGDGYVVMLTADAWSKLKTAVSGRIGFSLASTGGGDLKQFALSQPKSSYHNPVDGMNYEAEQGWVQYSSDGSGPKSTGPVVVDKYVLLTDQTKMAEYISVTSLVDYMKAIEEMVTAHVSQMKKETTSYEVIIESEVSPGGKAVYNVVARPPSIPSSLIQAVHQWLSSIKAPSTKGPIRFQVLLRLWPR